MRYFFCLLVVLLTAYPVWAIQPVSLRAEFGFTNVSSTTRQVATVQLVQKLQLEIHNRLGFGLPDVGQSYIDLAVEKFTIGGVFVPRVSFGFGQSFKFDKGAKSEGLFLESTWVQKWYKGLFTLTIYERVIPNRGYKKRDVGLGAMGWIFGDPKENHVKVMVLTKRPGIFLPDEYVQKMVLGFKYSLGLKFTSWLSVASESGYLWRVDKYTDYDVPTGDEWLWNLSAVFTIP